MVEQAWKNPVVIFDEFLARYVIGSQVRALVMRSSFGRGKNVGNDLGVDAIVPATIAISGRTGTLHSGQ